MFEVKVIGTRTIQIDYRRTHNFTPQAVNQNIEKKNSFLYTNGKIYPNCFSNSVQKMGKSFYKPVFLKKVSVEQIQ